MGEQTTLTRATSKSGSLRTTVPKGVVKHFDMKERDKLDWTMKVNGSKLTIEVMHVRAGGGRQRAGPAVRERKLARKEDAGEDGQDTRSKKRWRLK